jgi:anti-sigma B factor antagonist
VETAPQLREALADTIGSNAGERVVVDLAGTDFLDSSALGVLVGASKQLESKHANLTVVCTKQHLLRVFELTRLDQVISIVPTVEAAVAAV